MVTPSRILEPSIVRPPRNSCRGAEPSLCGRIDPTLPAVFAAPAEPSSLRKSATIPARTLPPIEVEAIRTAVNDILVCRLRSVAATGYRQDRHDAVALRF